MKISIAPALSAASVTDWNKIYFCASAHTKWRCIVWNWSNKKLY